jgi:hypothetical protein
MNRLLGFGEVWREDGTGTRAFFILWVRVWSRNFNHSTFLRD